MIGETHDALRLAFFATRLSIPLMLLVAPSISVGEKLVIAHYMTDMVPQTDRPLNRWIDPELADPNGSTAALGGIHQTVPMASLYLKNADLTTAVDFEIRAARQLGVDGFQFYYPLGDNTRALSQRYNEIIREFIRLSDTRYAGFKISVCLAHPFSEHSITEAERIKLWSPTIRSLVEETRNSPAWLRSKSGTLLFYLWVGDALADGVNGRANTPAQIRKVGEAYQRLSKAVGTPIEFVYQVRRPEIDKAYVDAMVETFPAVWGWTASEENPEFWDFLASRCQAKGCAYTQTVYPDYYTSKLYPKGDSTHKILSTAEALRVGVTGVERHYRVTNLAQTQIALLRNAIDRKATIINYATWNDFPEGHHLAPEINHNFGPSILLRQFKRQWKSGDSRIARDEAVVFFKKYLYDSQAKYTVPLVIKSKYKDISKEDRIELVTLLTEPAECFLNSKPLGIVPQGVQVHSIPSEAGSVHVRIVRNREVVHDFRVPVEISSKPLRTNRLTYSYSSAFDREFAQLFQSHPSIAQ